MTPDQVVSEEQLTKFVALDDVQWETMTQARSLRRAFSAAVVSMARELLALRPKEAGQAEAWLYRVFLHELTGEPTWSNWGVSVGPDDPTPSIGGRCEVRPLYASPPLSAKESPEQLREPAAWMTDDGRVASDETRRTAMHAVSKAAFHIPLYRALPLSTGGGQ